MKIMNNIDDWNSLSIDSKIEARFGLKSDFNEIAIPIEPSWESWWKDVSAKIICRHFDNFSKLWCTYSNLVLVTDIANLIEKELNIEVTIFIDNKIPEYSYRPDLFY